MPIDPALLEQFSFFKLLDSDEKKELANVLEIEKHQIGDVLFRHHEPGEAMYAVSSGQVELWVKDKTGARLTLLMAALGDVFGEISLLDGGPRTANATIAEDAELLVLRRKHLLEFLTRKPHAGIDLLATMAGRVRRADELLADRVTRNSNHEMEEEMTLFQRIAKFISDFSGSVPFLVMNTLVFVVWILVNTNQIPGIAAFDPFPFNFLTTAVSLEAIFLSIFVLLAQNLLAAKDKLRSDIEYEINLKAELEVSHLHEKVDRLHGELLSKIHSLESAVRR